MAFSYKRTAQPFPGILGLLVGLTDGIASQTVVPTTSTTFIDAFAGASITVPKTGNYVVTFEANITRTGGGTPDAEIAIGINSTTVPVASTVRGREATSGLGSVVAKDELFLNQGDTIHGLFRNLSGGPATVDLQNRSLTIVGEG